METSVSLPAIAIIVSLFVFYLSHKSAIITNIQNQLTIKAQECNKYINKSTLGPPKSTEDMSAALTNIIYAKRLLNMFCKNHWFFLYYYDKYDYVRFFYYQLHTSIIELIKLDLPEDIDWRNNLETQHLECHKFLEKIINENINDE